MESAKLSSAVQFEISELIESLKYEVLATRELISSAGYPITQAPRALSIENMMKLSPAQIHKLCFQLRLTRALCSSQAEEIENPTDDQRRLLKRALDFYGLEMNESMMEHIGPDDIIEVYSPASTQLYRSLNFFRTSGYSLEDLLLNEWYILWERPQSVIDKVMVVMNQLLEGQNEILPFDLPVHIVREIFQENENQQGHRLIKVDLKLGIALRRKGSQKVSALVVASTAKVLDQDQGNAQTLRFL
jgi:hypothetical protein